MSHNVSIDEPSTVACADIIDSLKYERDGYFIARELLTLSQLERLRCATDEAVLRRAEPILFEENVTTAGDAVPARYKDDAGRIFRRLNRVLDRGGIFEELGRGALARVATALAGGPVSLCLNRHNMLMLKAPRNPAPVPWHQDSAIWNEGTFEHFSAIVALDDFQADNGPLMVVPGSHRRGPIGLGAENVPTIAAQCAAEVDNTAVIVDLKAGDVLYFHGLLMHGSPGNLSDSTRRSMTLAFHPGDLRARGTKTGSDAPLVWILDT